MDKIVSEYKQTVTLEMKNLRRFLYITYFGKKNLSEETLRFSFARFT